MIWLVIGVVILYTLSIELEIFLKERRQENEQEKWSMDSRK
jgi:hypothetical protein